MIQISKKNFIILIIITALIGTSIGAGGYFVVNNVILDKNVTLSANDYSYYQTLSARYGKLDSLYNTLSKYYYKDLDEEKLKQGMYSGLFWGTGDPYTNYMTKEEYDNLVIKTTGKLQGIGVTMGIDKNGYIVVVSVIKDSPAEHAGMKAGDLILAVDGVEYAGSNLDTAVANMRGDAGTKVNVTYSRNGENKDVVITRANITLDSVYAKTLENNIGYIYINSFETGTADDFEKELRNLEMKGVDGLIIDLRNNGGGVVESGVKIADMLLDEGVIAYTEGKTEERSYMKSTTGKTNLPYVLLINGGTASTSEIVAASIKDEKGGKIVGTTSFGKGVIQSMAPLKEGDAVKITIAQYFSPNGNVIQGVGVKPDYVVEMTENDKTDTQLEKAIELLRK
ncbi:S41 family peptidase [Clostridium aminobutyricum]|uniref:S41 family peptidase n=1 Tax=Clostridium aminobutyricum TaxID=33953 RepID=A0A939IIU2_CLOAM|nr:S41 family peptidase [Clostridium aminobutyricum]MBN7772874.1 S41 family peptidase [Clostridium aminobutyricum]